MIQEGQSKWWGAGVAFTWVTRAGLVEKPTFADKLEADEGVSHARVWGKHLPSRGHGQGQSLRHPCAWEARGRWDWGEAQRAERRKPSHRDEVWVHGGLVGRRRARHLVLRGKGSLQAEEWRNKHSVSTIVIRSCDQKIATGNKQNCDQANVKSTSRTSGVELQVIRLQMSREFAAGKGQHAVSCKLKV